MKNFLHTLALIPVVAGTIALAPAPAEAFWGNKCDAVTTEITDTLNHLVSTSRYADLTTFDTLANAVLPKFMQQSAYVSQNCYGKVSPSVGADYYQAIVDYIEVLDNYGYDTSALRQQHFGQ